MKASPQTVLAFGGLGHGEVRNPDEGHFWHDCCSMAGKCTLAEPEKGL